MRLFLDFDGVVCDSVGEAQVASHRAYCQKVLGSSADELSEDDRARFISYRPFIRNGEDFVLLQQLIREGIQLSSQADFDRELLRAGAATMQRYRDAIYSVREQMLAEDRAGWLALNRIYPHVRAVIDRPAGDDRCFILSTKKAQYINEILNGEGVRWPATRIISTEGREKVTLIEQTAGGDNEIHFVEDQPDHFPSPGERPAALHCVLATWGYIQPQWLESSAYTTIGPQEFADFLDRLLSR
ncbi:MAG: hypothetical protein EA403_09485 [Spirochaetaceae bacterium]|nr:MAG: hypothetical protein EA403_09485 [Spirochaetaceae bacterium]